MDLVSRSSLSLKSEVKVTATEKAEKLGGDLMLALSATLSSLDLIL